MDTLGNYTTNTYDSSGNLTNVTMVDATSHVLSVTGYAYDANGNRTVQSVQRTTPSGVVQDVTSYAYDGLNRLVATVAPDGSTNTVTYDAAGHQVATTDGLGRVTQLRIGRSAGELLWCRPFLPVGQHHEHLDLRRRQSAHRAVR